MPTPFVQEAILSPLSDLDAFVTVGPGVMGSNSGLSTLSYRFICLFSIFQLIPVLSYRGQPSPMTSLSSSLSLFTSHIASRVISKHKFNSCSLLMAPFV